MKKLESAYATTHKRIIEMVEQMMEETKANAVIITDLARELKIDTRVLNKHLEVLELGGWGCFTVDRHLFVRSKR